MITFFVFFLWKTFFGVFLNRLVCMFHSFGRAILNFFAFGMKSSLIWWVEETEFCSGIPSWSLLDHCLLEFYGNWRVSSWPPILVIFWDLRLKRLLMLSHSGKHSSFWDRCIGGNRSSLRYGNQIIVEKCVMESSARLHLNSSVS